MISCASSTKTNISDIHINYELLESCKDLPILESGMRKDVILYIFDLKTAYSTCKEKHSLLSNTINDIINYEK